MKVSQHGLTFASSTVTRLMLEAANTRATFVADSGDEETPTLAKFHALGGGQRLTFDVASSMERQRTFELQNSAVYLVLFVWASCGRAPMQNCYVIQRSFFHERVRRYTQTRPFGPFALAIAQNGRFSQYIRC